MTEKQIKTMLLWAQNYTMPEIAHKLGVAVSTIKTRLKQIQHSHPKEFENTLGLRNAHKKTKKEIANTKPFTELGLSRDGYYKHHTNNHHDITGPIPIKRINGKDQPRNIKNRK